MTWSASLLLALAAAGAGDSTVPAGLEQRVRDAIAQRWEVEAAIVRVEWGRTAGHAGLRDSAAFRLAGRGDDGRFIAIVDTERGEVAVGLRAGRETAVWVAQRPLVLGAVLTPADVRQQSRLVWGAPPMADDLTPVGWEVRRALRAGDMVAPPAIVEPAVINAGDLVRFEFRIGAMLVVREGIAAAPARRGERVWARDRLRAERIDGIATGPGTARLEGRTP
jgi:flagella basal body P-ring formation protein FlgA